jgi:hypothetical protein
VRLHDAMGVVSLYKGDIAGAIPQFEEGVRIAHQHSTEDPQFAAMESIDLAALGIAQMRRGEVENCATRHTADMCIFPLSLAARHTLRSGSERAIEYFERYLEREPSNLEIRWLLNIAYQTLGEYPDIRAAIGAKIKLTLAGLGQANPIRYREVSSGGSFGASPLMQHIGIGKATQIASIEVTWPASRTQQVFKNVAPNQFIEIKEFEKTYIKRRVRPITFKRPAVIDPRMPHRHPAGE